MSTGKTNILYDSYGEGRFARVRGLPDKDEYMKLSYLRGVYHRQKYALSSKVSDKSFKKSYKCSDWESPNTTNNNSCTFKKSL
jgi:hypothetical protein